MKSKNTIEINGKLYDAKTGLPLAANQAKKSTDHVLKSKPVTKPQATKATPTRPTTARKSIDGFAPRTKSQQAASKNTVHHTASSIKSATPSAPITAREKSRIKLKAKRSTTLNRSVVHTPNFAITPVAAAPTSTPTPSEHEIPVSSALKHADSSREKRARQITKSTAISRFSQATQDASNKPALTNHLVKTHAQAPIKAAPDASANKHVSTKEKLIKKAMDQAVTTVPSAKHHRKKAKRLHIGKYATSALVVVLLAGYVAYLNIPSISLKVAAHRAGFAASMPSYRPAGYSLKGPIAYSPGQVTLNFASNTDQRKFTLKQQPTTWDSTALLENYVMKESPRYLTYQDSGLTIYILDGNNAAWVSAGKFYQVESKDSQLDTDQLLKLATSV